ncbi:MAG: serine/threonine protein kinase, partial [Verrucomicrobia bacterium]|nr:serine/threonine protein kinase [Verrucomicrobiota bacterium]
MAADAPQGLCPNCLMKVAMGSEAGNPGAAPVERQRALAPEEIAKHFPQVEILTLLGQGGMGAVYKASQPALDRFVALKILPAHAAADAGFAERFNREARALAKLNHPNIVAVYEFGQADGLHYLIMEYVDGLNLRQLQQTGKLPPREALQIIPQICEALQFAHDEGVVHRDIKPENVLLDKKGRVKIADFGLARILGVEPESFRLTGAGDYMGTPHYMAPEQIERPREVDHRADIYSLGVVFYEMLTGELPLGKFQPPSKKVQVDVRLDEVVLHALEKEPQRRYQQASQVKTDVETIAHTAPPSSTVSPAVLQRRHGLRVKSTVLFVASACFLVASLLFALSGNGIAAMLSVGAMIGLGFVGYGNLRAASALDAPFSPPVSAQVVAAVRQQVKGPASWLVVTGILNWIAIPLIVLVTAAMVSGKGVVVFTLPTLLAMILSSVIILAGLRMKRLEAYPLALVGSILAMLVTPGNLIGLPVGIWSLVVLCRREVREAFGGKLPLDLGVLGAATAAPLPRSDGFWRRFAVVIALVLLALILIPVGPILLGIALPALNRAKFKVQQQAEAGRVPMSLRPVHEAVIYSMTAQRPIRLLDLDRGAEIELPAEREKGTEEQFFHWIAEHGVDLMAQGHRTSWTLTTALKLASLEETSWSVATPATLRE